MNMRLEIFKGENLAGRERQHRRSSEMLGDYRL